MSYLPPNRLIRLGDTWEYSEGDKVHAFFLQYQEEHTASAGRESGALGHAVSTDLLHWETLPSILYPTPEPGAYDDCEIWTGCTIREMGKYWIYYTSRSSSPDGYMQSISAAVSEDGVHFTKLKENPLLIPDSKYYSTKTRPVSYQMHGNNGKDTFDCRDMCVVKDPSGSFWWGFFAVRQPAESCTETTVIGLAKSKDLIHWEQLPPCFVPKHYHCVETPEVFFMNGKWYMLCLSGNIYGQRNAGSRDFAYPLITIYAVADRPEGPYTEPEDSLLLGTMGMSGNCAKTVLHKGKRYVFHVERLDKKDGSSEMYMSAPKVIEADASGKLYAGLYDGYPAYYTDTKEIGMQNLIEKGGRWGTPGKWSQNGNAVTGTSPMDWCLQPLDEKYDNFVLEADITPGSADGTDGTDSAGFAFGLGDNVMEGGFVLLLDYRKNQVLLTGSRTFTLIDGWSMNLSGTHRLTLICSGHTVEAYIDGKLAVNHLLEKISGRPALFVERGSAVFANTRIHRMKAF